MAEQIRRINATTAKYADFVDVMLENQPKDGRADTDFLRRELGGLEVPVVECSSSEGYGQERRTSMTLRHLKYVDLSAIGARKKRVLLCMMTPKAGEYLDAVHDGIRPSQGGVGNELISDGAVLYLKDWHYQKLRREGGDGESCDSSPPVETPLFFEDDWLNWWCDRQGQDDYRFVYIGPSGSFTGLHHDVLNSFSWSFNVCGSKHWILFPTEATPDLYDRHGRDLAADVRDGCKDPTKFPRLDAAPRIELWQGPGEAIFVPSGWHHQVVNTGDGRPGGGGLTISVNTNWFNGFNLERVYAFLRSELDAVRLELDHLRDSWSEGPAGRGEGDGDGEGRGWERQCELVMRANSALSLTEFARMVMARAQLLLGSKDATADSAAAVSAPAGDGKSSSVPGAGRASPRNSGDSGRIRSGEWREERWTILALDQVGAVLRELSVSPCIDHIFLTEEDDDDQCGGTRSQSSRIGAPEITGAAGDSKLDEEGAGKVPSLMETLEAVEAYLRDRCLSKSSRLPPS